MKIDQNNFNEINRLGDSNIPAQNAVQAALNIINAIPSGSTSSDTNSILSSIYAFLSNVSTLCPDLKKTPFAQSLNNININNVSLPAITTSCKDFANLSISAADTTKIKNAMISFIQGDLLGDLKNSSCPKDNFFEDFPAASMAVQFLYSASSNGNNSLIANELCKNLLEPIQLKFLATYK
jgi:hypothetical protein